jgi:hypothetical protein
VRLRCAGAVITERSPGTTGLSGGTAQPQRHARELAIGGLPSIVPTVTMKVMEFVGGPHDGEVQDHPDPMPETLFAITFRDGSRYARVSERKAENSDDVAGLFRFDPTSVVARRALTAMGLPPDTPCYGPPSPPPHRSV